MPRASFFQQPSGSEIYPTVGEEERRLPGMLSEIASHLAIKRQQLQERRGLAKEGITVPGMEVPQTLMEKIAFALRKPTQPSDLTQTIIKTQLETKRAIDVARATALIDYGKDVPKTEKDLRDEFIKQSKNWKEVRDSYGRVQASAQDPSAAGDLALIFNYMKILDPGSVVRESEFANAAASGAFGERLKAAGLRIMAGQRLSDIMRNDFVGRAKMLYQVKQRQHGQLESEYTRLANALPGVNPKNVIVELGLIEGEKTLSPKSRTVDISKPLTLLTPEELNRLNAQFE